MTAVPWKHLYKPPGDYESHGENINIIGILLGLRVSGASLGYHSQAKLSRRPLGTAKSLPQVGTPD